MEIRCPACATRYTADDDKLRGKTVTMRCRACNVVWQVSGSESFKQTLPPPPSLGVGARHEDSVLFRVDQLARLGRLNTPAPTESPALTTPPDPASSAGDDEGILDLHTLASVAPRGIGMPIAPLFSEPPPGIAVDVNAAPRPAVKRSNKLPLIGGIAAAAALVLVAGFGISVAFKGVEPVKHTAAFVAPPPATEEAPPPKLEPAPPAPAAPVAAASDDASSSDDAADAKSAKVRRGKAGAATKSKATKSKATKGPSTNKPPARTAKPVKAADPCGCKGDFNCILACTAGHKKK